MNKQRNTKNLRLTYGALIASMYIALTVLSQVLGLASGPIQFRISEALCVLPLLTPSAIPGLMIGCLLSNVLIGSMLWDTIFGTLATLIGAIGTYYLGKKNIYAGILCPIISNTVIIPFVLSIAYGSEGTIPYFMLTIFIGEFVTCGVLGYLLYKALKDKRIFHE